MPSLTIMLSKITAKLCSDNHIFELSIFISVVLHQASFHKDEQVNMLCDITWLAHLSNKYVTPITFQAWFKELEV